MNNYITSFKDRDKFLRDYEKLGFTKHKYSDSENNYYSIILLRCSSDDDRAIELLIHDAPDYSGDIDIEDDIDSVEKYTIDKVMGGRWSWSLVGILTQLVADGYINAPSTNIFDTILDLRSKEQF